MTNLTSYRKQLKSGGIQAKQPDVASISWTLLNQRVVALANNHASAKEIAELIIRNADFAHYVISMAGFKKRHTVEQATIIHAILLIGVDRLCELLLAVA